MVSVEWGSATDTGRVRGHNEDALLAEAPIFAVADGMGGHAAGDLASALAVEALEDLTGRDGLTPDDLQGAVADANERIHEAGERRPEVRGMGTTLTGLALVVVDGAERVAVFNVGDSRVYRLVDGTLEQVTVDHSEVQELVSAGHISPDEARSYARRNVITRSLGGPPVQADVWVLDPAGRFLACSDGVSGELSDAQIAEVLGSSGTPQEVADRLVVAAVEAGGHDNATAVVVDLS